MSGLALLCSGQGGQVASMFDLVADAPGAQEAFAAAKARLGTDPREIVRTADAETLHANGLGQILCCTQAMAACGAIVDMVPRPDVVAGYSVGELVAWGVAGFFDVPTVLHLAEQRAAAMDAATVEPGGLLAIRGLPRSRIEALCAGQDVFVAIVNGADRFIVGGGKPALTRVAEAATEAGAQRTTLLPVAVASHTPLLAAAAEAFAAALREAPRQEAPHGIRLLSGIDGTPVFDIDDGLGKLARQIRQTVEWDACLEAVLASRVDTVLELGPGNALAAMVQDRAPDLRTRGLAEFRTLDGLRRWLGAR